MSHSEKYSIGNDRHEVVSQKGGFTYMKKDKSGIVTAWRQFAIPIFVIVSAALCALFCVLSQVPK